MEKILERLGLTTKIVDEATGEPYYAYLKENRNGITKETTSERGLLCGAFS